MAAAALGSFSCPCITLAITYIVNQYDVIIKRFEPFYFCGVRSALCRFVARSAGPYPPRRRPGEQSVLVRRSRDTNRDCRLRGPGSSVWNHGKSKRSGGYSSLL